MLEFIIAAIAGAVITRFIGMWAETGRLTKLATALAPGDGETTIEGTLVGPGDERGLAVHYMFHGAHQDGVPPASITRTSRFAIRTDDRLVTVDGSLHVLVGSGESRGDRETIVETDPSLRVPANWSQVAIRTLAYGDRVRARGKLVDRDGDAALEAERIVIAHDPLGVPPPKLALAGAILGVLVWLVVLAIGAVDL